MLSPGDVVGDRFEVDRQAGVGGMGAVYRARDRWTGQMVALKLLAPRGGHLTERFAREARILADLSHPGVVRYIDHGVLPQGAHYLAMEWLEGEDLAQRLARVGLTIAETVTVATQVAATLAVLHQRGIVHRDIKPANLFLVDGLVDQVRLLDFGVVHAERPVSLTQTGDMIGTPAYMAPEQARGDKTVRPAVDVFALGAVLWECLIGRAIFAAGNVLAVMARVVFAEVPPPRETRPEIPRALDDLVMAMLSKEPAARPPDGGAVLEALRAIDVDSVTATGAAASLPPVPGVLGAHERRLVSIVLASPPPAARRIDPSARETMHTPGMEATEPARMPPPASPSAPTDVAVEANTLLRELWTAAERYGARIEPLLDGSVAAMVVSTGWASDLAVRAARCALAMRAALPAARMAVATCRAVVGARLPMGEAIDAATALLRADRKSAEGGHLPVRLDEMTAGLLDGRFDISGDAHGLGLRAERPFVETQRSLLGKPTPCVGRERELAALEALFDECCAEPVARAVLVSGPAGVGKSRVRHELVRKLRARDVPVEIWVGRGDPMSAGSPFGLLTGALRQAASLVEGELMAVRQAKLRARVARSVPPEQVGRVTDFLGELMAVPTGGEPGVQLRAARSDAALMGDQMRRAFEDFVRAEAGAQPVVLILEDLQWGDLPTIKLVDGALRHVADRPFLVVAVARPEVHDMFPTLWAERGLQELRLGEIGKRAAERLVRDVLGDVTADMCARLVEQAGGNPFYLEELIRAVAEGRGEELPPTVLAMVQTRLEALPAEARRVLRAASVYGRAFHRGAVVALLGAEVGTDLREWLDLLVEKEVVRQRAGSRFPGEQELVFRHTLVRDAAYAMLTEQDRVLGHRLAGEWLEKMGETDVWLLAEHFERGHDPARAIRLYRRAAEQALEGNDLDAALTCAERGVTCGARGEDLGALRLIQAEAHGWRGDYVLRGQCSLEARNLLPRGTSLWYAAAADLAVVSRVLGHKETLREVCSELLSVHSDQILPRATALARTAAQVIIAGDLRLGEKLLEAADAQALDDPAVAAWAHTAHAARAAVEGDTTRCLRSSELSAQNFVFVGNMRCACIDWSNVGYALAELGQLEDAEAILRDMLADAERMGLPMIVGGARQNLALTFLRLGKLEEARAMAESAIAIFARQSDARSEGWARQYLARALLLQHDYERAEVEARTAVDNMAGVAPGLPSALATLAEVHRVRGNVADARHEARSAWEVARNGGVEEGEAWIAAVYGDVLADLGDLEGARATVAAGRARLLERAEKIDDPEQRRSFLERVPENVRLLARAREWLDQ